VTRASFKRLARSAGGLLLLATGVACGGPGFDKPMLLGGRLVQPATLDRGRDLYNRFCAACHGFDGRATTAEARQLVPPPRDFSRAEFKRASKGGLLPTDAELARLINNGVPATGMPAWQALQGDDLDSVIQYLKTFSPRWLAAAPDAFPKVNFTP